MKRIFILSIILLFCIKIYAQQWAPVADIPAGVHHPVSWGIGDYGYSATGVDTNDQPTKLFYRYDPQADKWTRLPDFPGLARGFAIGVTHQGVGYLGFGGTSNNNYLKDLWKYDTATMSWTQLASCPCAGRLHPSMVAVNGAIYVGLGNGQLGNLQDWRKYDISTDTWAAVPNLPGPPRHHPFQFAANGRVYAGMGHGSNSIYADWYELDLTTDAWTKMTDFPGEARVAGTQLDYNSKGYVLSGDGDDHSTMGTGEFWEYDETTDSWTELSPHPGRSRWAPGSFVVHDELYFFGGLDRFANYMTRKAYKYHFLGNVGSGESAEIEVEIYPNPAVNYLIISSTIAYKKVEIINLNGSVVYSRGQSTKIDLTTFPKGAYFLAIWDENEVLHRHKFLKH